MNWCRVIDLINLIFEPRYIRTYISREIAIFISILATTTFVIARFDCVEVRIVIRRED